MPREAGADLRLRAWEPGDLGLLERLLGDPAMTVHLGGPESAEQLARRHERYLCPDEPGAVFAITLAPSGRAVGWVGYWESGSGEDRAWEMGWNVVPEYQGRGIASAATLLALRGAAGEGTHRFARAFPSVHNTASNAVCRRAGFRLEGEVDIEYPPGRPMRSNRWAFDLAELPEWPVGGGAVRSAKSRT